MKLNEVSDITIDGVKAHVHELIFSTLKKLERDYDLSLIKPFYKHVKIQQNKNSPNLVKVTFLLPKEATPASHSMHFASGPRPHSEVEAEKFAAKINSVARELFTRLSSA